MSPQKSHRGNIIMILHVVSAYISGIVQSILHAMLHFIPTTMLKLQIRDVSELPHGHTARK